MDPLISLFVVFVAAFGMMALGFGVFFAVMCKTVGVKKAVEVMKRGVSIN